MKYIATRGESPSLSFSEATLQGLSKNGGLYVPETTKRLLIDDWLGNATYRETALAVLSPFVGKDIPADDLEAIVQDSYDPSNWNCEEVTPVTRLEDNDHVLELFHGQSAAFKDVAMSAVSRVIRHNLAITGDKITIVVATSGDTGPAAIKGFANIPGVELFVLFPARGTSDFQRKQMTTETARNVHALAIEAPFDPIQAMVKSMLLGDFHERYKTRAVNSIAWARIWAQIPYYFYGYPRGVSEIGERLTYIVPTGNFGNIFAGWESREMGLPIDLVLATNSNKVLVKFINEGVYEPQKETIPTISPSMDIQGASNLERLVFYLVGCDPDRVRHLYARLLSHGRFSLEGDELDRLHECGIRAGFATEEEAKHQILKVFKKHGYVIDPHTANGFAVAEKLKIKGPRMYVSTASPIKFEPAVRAAAVYAPLKRPANLVGIENLPERVKTLPNDVDAVKRHIVKVLEAA